MWVIDEYGFFLFEYFVKFGNIIVCIGYKLLGYSFDLKLLYYIVECMRLILCYLL